MGTGTMQLETHACMHACMHAYAAHLGRSLFWFSLSSFSLVVFSQSVASRALQDASVLVWDTRHWGSLPRRFSAPSSVGSSGGPGGGLGLGEDSPSATCVAFSPSGRCAAVGTSESPYLILHRIGRQDQERGGSGAAATEHSELGGVGAFTLVVHQPEMGSGARGSVSAGSVAHLEGHAQEVTNVCFSHRGDRLLSGSRDGTTRVWKWRVGVERAQELRLATGGEASEIHRTAIASHTGAKPLALWVDMVGWNADDSLIYSAESLRKQTREATCVSSCIRVWSRNGTLLTSFPGGVHPTYVLQPHPTDAGILASAGYDGALRIWDTHTGVQLSVVYAPGTGINCELLGQPDALLDASWSMDGTLIAVGCESGALLIAGIASQPRLQEAPPQQFFGVDSHPLIHDAQNNAVDTIVQAATKPHS